MDRFARRSQAACLALAGLCLCAGCVTYGPIGEPEKFVSPVVGVVCFENRAPFPLRWELGDGMAEMLTAALVKCERVTVVSRSELKSVLEELGLQRDPRFRRQGRVGRGRLKNAQYLIRGTVIDFTHTVGGGIEVVRSFIFSGKIALVTITVSVINVETREVMTETFSGTASASETTVEARYKGVAFGGDVFHNTPLGKATQEAIWDAVHWVVERIASVPWQPHIAQIAGKTVFVSGGKDREMRVGELLEVCEPGQPILDPSTGDEIGRGPVRVMGRLFVTQVLDRMSKARILSGADLRVGQRCHRVQPTDSP